MNFKHRLHTAFIFFILVLFGGANILAQQQKKLPVKVNQQGILEYTADSKGNRVPDFSFCGYASGDKEIPEVPVEVFIPWKEGDATQRIQKAIDYLSEKPLNGNGFRGTILLDKGVFSLQGRLLIKKAGIVLRGSGIGENGTTIIASSKARETLITIRGSQKKLISAELPVAETYVPVNSITIPLAENHSFEAGDKVAIRRPSTEKWIDTLKMYEFGGETSWLGWKPGRNNIVWFREVVSVTSTSITVDVPITTALDPEFGGGFVQKYTVEDALTNVGIENLNLESEYNKNNLKDENHCWMAITIEDAENCWVRQVNFRHFAGSAVMVLTSAQKITVEDCISEEPVSEIAAQRRFTFFTEGQQTLFQRCYAEYGYHDFAVGNFAAGPNAFVQCKSYLPYNFSGTIDRWASGVLFDLVNVDGHNLSLMNRWSKAQGAGWTAANSMIWQCSAAQIDCYSPPTATNWAFGAWGQFGGNGFWHEANSHIKPRSLYYAQLADRLGADMTNRAQFLPITFGSTSSPPRDLAKELAAKSHEPLPVLEDWITQASSRNSISTEKENATLIDNIADNRQLIASAKNTIAVKNGWIVDNSGVAIGQTLGIQWWRGNIRPHTVAKAGPHITRFVPGKTGTGYTDNLDSVAQFMVKNNIRAIDHHYGLWYERRRDDHERIRRRDGEVWPPFYEMPFSRSGEGSAWDALSKYDLNQPNTWYWSRLHDFATLADQNGLVLIHQNYFQHNILEAGAHYADFPWRTANNINNPGLPEPVPYAGDKRIFIAEQFYDLSNEHLRDLHKQYIWQCLDNFKDNSNVIQLISEEFTGPLHFVEFWLDVIAEWQEENGIDALIGLSTTKDVQDVILSDPDRSKIVDIIDIKYWHYTKDGELYAPKGGLNLAPRQYLRLDRPKGAGFETVYKAVVEYKTKYPEKAVTYSNYKDQKSNWAIFMAGGSLAGIPDMPSGFIEDAGTMMPQAVKPDQSFILINNLKEQIIYCRESVIKVNLTKTNGDFKAQWIDIKTGQAVNDAFLLSGGKSHKITVPQEEIILWVFKD